MSQTLLNATWRVETMVGRERELDMIKSAIYKDADDRCCTVVLVKGVGGIGKSRLLEEVLWRAGHPVVRENVKRQAMRQPRPGEDWTTSGDIVISTAIDLMDIRLSAKTQFLQALRDALSWQEGVDFSNYEAAMRSHLRALEGSADFKTIKSRAGEVEQAFWEAFREQAQQRRIVLVLDTAERLVLRSSRWLLDRGLLKDEELRELSSQQWLLWQMKMGRFENTTLVIAGRDDRNEGGPFFDQIKDVVNNSETPCTLLEIELDHLNEDETIAYFVNAAEEWEERASSVANLAEPYRGEHSRVGRTMRNLAADEDRLKALHELTGGRPVLLSLYADLIHEPDSMPVLLQLKKEEVESEIRRRGRETVGPQQAGVCVEEQAEQVRMRGRKALQAEIERSFIELLFQKPGLRSQIMQALARCPAGLDTEQLHFVIDSKSHVDLTDWKPNPIRMDEIKVQIEQIRLLSIARPRPDNRLGLQDEIYRIYAQRMSDSEELRSYEQEERARQYQRLSTWADARLQKLKGERQEFQQEDERRLVLAIHSPTVALRPYLPSITLSEQEERSYIQQAIRDWELERLHYDLLRSPRTGLNDSYTDLTERRWLSNIEEEEFIAQQEMWRVLHDPYALRFTGLSEKELAVLQRAAHDEDPARWIKRFVLRRDYASAINFWRDVEAAILTEEQEAQRTWLHPLNEGERMIWKSYAQIMQGEPSISSVVDKIKLKLDLLIRLASAPQDKPIGPRGEAGFQGHPALPRLHRIIAVGYNFAGYGRVVVGQYGKGVGNYTRALVYMRETKSKAQQAGTRNNLGRALASLGRDERGHRICADALTLRRELGAEIPIAYSLNTLALIGNGMQRTPTAWREAAQAAAIFRRAGDNRGLGLALIQLGIGLRRLANSQEPGVVLEATPEELHATAQRALGEAVDIFDGDPEVLRLIEARIELGCVLRDQMRIRSIQSSPGRLARLYRDAEIEYDKAIKLAREKQFGHLVLQAEVDRAWAHFYANHLGEAEGEAQRAEEEINSAYLIVPGCFPSPKTDESYNYYQLAKIQGLYAAIAMRRFEERREKLRKIDSHYDRTILYDAVEHDTTAKNQMAASAKAYVLSLAYGQLYSPRSRSLVITFDQIYDHLKEFNMVEYRMFRNAQRQAQENIWGEQVDGVPSAKGIKAYDFSNLDDWLEDCFGPLKVHDE